VIPFAGASASTLVTAIGMRGAFYWLQDGTDLSFDEDLR
jgi:hypothetical protein